MAFTALVANPGRLQILTALAVDERQEFVQLRRATRLTDGNLAAHARRLEAGGLIAIDKRFREGKPVTSITLTVEGRKALEIHTRRLIAAISYRRLDRTAESESIEEPEPVAAAISVEGEIEPPSDDGADDTWVD